MYPKVRGETSIIQEDGEALDVELGSAADKSQRRLLLSHYMEIILSNRKVPYQQLHQESAEVGTRM